MSSRAQSDVSVTLQRPTQAVILAGGRGTRLLPLTETRPKPMVEICGKAFLEYHIEQLYEQGFHRVLLLLGYLPEVIQDYFGDGRRWGIEIQYLVSAIEDETGRRLKLAEPHLDAYFLLMYCDNYWPMQIDQMWEHFTIAKTPAMLTVYSNDDAYTRSCVRVEPDGLISLYDKTCANPSLNGVEIGYAILSRQVIAGLNEDNVSFELAVYPRLAEQKELAGYVTQHRYYSVGSYKRIPLTEQFFKRRPTVILDRDGVLNRKPPKARYVCCWEDFEWLPGVKEALRELHERSYRVLVVSNQAGVARGVLTEATLLEIHNRMKEEVEVAGGKIDAIYYCPHDWNENCSCRKPSPGLLYQAQRDWNLDLSRTLFVGDDERDGEAAKRAGCPFAQVSENLTLEQIISGVL